MGRDHSYKCETCGCQRGGFDVVPCDCDIGGIAFYLMWQCLAHNLAIAGALCAAFDMGRDAGPGKHVPFVTCWWRPGCGKPWSWPHITRCDRSAP